MLMHTRRCFRSGMVKEAGCHGLANDGIRTAQYPDLGRPRGRGTLTAGAISNARERGKVRNGAGPGRYCECRPGHLFRSITQPKPALLAEFADAVANIPAGSCRSIVVFFRNITKRLVLILVVEIFLFLLPL